LNEKNNYGWTPFIVACCSGREDMVELLINTKGFDSLNDKNDAGETAFMFACR